MKGEYYLTFCNKSQHRKAYITILASSYESAYSMAVATFGMHWQNLYEPKDLPPKRYPKGSVMTLESH